MAEWADGVELPFTDELARTHLAPPDVRGADARSGRRGRRPPCAMRVWVDLTNSPHVLVLRPVIDVLRARGAEVRVTARDFAQTVRCASASGIEHEVIGRHRGGAPRRQGARPRRSLAGADALGPACRALRPRARPRLQRRHRGRARCCASRARRCSTTSGRRCSTTSTAAWPRPSWCPTRSRPSAWTATARGASCSRYPGLKEEYYLADFEPDPAVLAELGLDRARRSRSCARRRRSRSTTASRTTSSPACSTGCAARQTVVLPRVAEQRAQLDGFIVPERAIDAQSLVALRRPRGQRRRHHEPRGGRAGHAGVDDVRGPPRRRRRTPHRRGPPAPPGAPRAARADEAGAAAWPKSGSGATLPCWRTCSARRWPDSRRLDVRPITGAIR